MNLDQLLDLLDHTPVIADIHPVSLCYLPDDVMVSNSLTEVALTFDELQPILMAKLIITSSDPMYTDRFPHVRCEHEPFTSALNSIIFKRFDDIASCTLRQSELAGCIVSDAKESEIVVVLLVDGLSYQDVRDWNSPVAEMLVTPCLVDVPSLTRVAFPNLIGSPPLAVRLFDAGHHHRLGFSYWTREDNRLTDRLFFSIPTVKKTGDFSEIIMSLRNHLTGRRQSKSFVQIVRTGLDGYAHAQKRKPPIPAIVQEIRQEFDQLTVLCDELSQEIGIQIVLYLASDHGILWRDEFEPEIVGDAPGKSSPRWSSWSELYHQREQGRKFRVDGEEYYCLDFPKLRRPLHIDEQGVHGGISFQESIVPFISMKFGAS